MQQAVAVLEDAKANVHQIDRSIHCHTRTTTLSRTVARLTPHSAKVRRQSRALSSPLDACSCHEKIPPHVHEIELCVV